MGGGQKLLISVTLVFTRTTSFVQWAGAAAGLESPGTRHPSKAVFVKCPRQTLLGRLH